MTPGAQPSSCNDPEGNYACPNPDCGIYCDGHFGRIAPPDKLPGNKEGACSLVCNFCSANLLREDGGI